MKRIFVTFIAAATLLAGCTKDDTGINTPAEGNQLNLKATVAAMRATATAFEQGDKIGLFLTDLQTDEAAYTNELLTVSATGTLKGTTDLTYPVKTKSVGISAYYPYAEGNTAPTAIPVDLPADQTDVDESEYDLMGANIADMQPTSDEVVLEFSHLLSKVKVEVVAGDDATDVEVADAEVRLLASVKGNVDIVSGAVASPEAATELKGNSLLVLPQEITGVMAKAYTSYGTFDIAAPAGGLVLEAGKMSTVTVKVNVKEQTGMYVSCRIENWQDSDIDSISVEQPLYPDVIDLSENGTANCYVVNKPGQLYCFDATVRGNGKSVGDIIATPINASKAFIYWTTLPIYADPNTTDADYRNNMGLGSDATMNKTIVRKSVKLEGGKVYFYTNPDMADGNVSIAVADADNNILWSWHIWAINDLDLDACAIAIDHPAVKGITMLDRNLGAYSNGSLQTYGDVSNAFGLYYQWGRKDPLPGNRALNGYHYYYYWYDAKTDTDIYKQGTGVASVPKYSAAQFSGWQEAVAYSIANPVFHIVPYGSVVVGGTAPKSISYTSQGSPIWPYTWFKSGVPDDGWSGLWGNPDGKQELGSGSKTIYDPCPVGWRVPEPEAFRFITVDGTDLPTVDSAKNCAWKINCAEPVSDAAVIDATKYHGFHFYVKGAKSLSEDQVVLPDDQTTIFFPASGGIGYTGGPDSPIASNVKWSQIGTNAPLVETVVNQETGAVGINRVTSYMASMRTDGVMRSHTYGARYEQLASAYTVRCIKE